MRPLPFVFLAYAVFSAAMAFAQAMPQKSVYPDMAPLDRYLIADKDAEIALARTAAPPSISNEAEVMVLAKDGYATAAKGSNGFLCVVERSWGAATDDAEFWNPKVRSPICFNPAAARSFAPIYLMKTKLVMAGKPKAEIVHAVEAAFASGELAALDPGAMSYMMSKQQYLNDRGKGWHPHVMFFVPGDAAKSWGADLQGSPLMASNDPEERATIFMMWTSNWSDGTPAPPLTH